MNSRNPQYLRGRFEGAFLLEPGNSGSALEHLDIYRGVIHEFEFISEEQFLQHGADHAGERLRNIELDLSNGSVGTLPRLFDLGAYRISTSQCSELHTISGKRYGTISGLICADIRGIWSQIHQVNEGNDEVSRSESNWSEGELTGTNEEQEQTPHQDPPAPSNDDAESGGTGSDNEPKSNAGKSIHPRIWLVPFLLVLIWLFTATEWGQHWVCLLQKRSIDKKIEMTQAEILRLERIIQQTQPATSQCGTEETFSGKNLQQNFTYTLGEISGEVLIAYDMYEIPDRMEVIFNGHLVAITSGQNGFASGQDTLRFAYDHSPHQLNELTIRMIPNEIQAWTEWKFNVMCPQ